MAVITLSWQLGCRGDQIAEEVAEELQYRIVGKQELHDMLIRTPEYFAENAGIEEFSQVVNGEIQPDFFFRRYQDASLDSSLLMSLIYKAASQDDIVVKGFGAHLLLAAQLSMLSARLQGSLEERIGVIQDVHQLTPQAAKAMIKKDDRDRMGFVQYLFRRELTDMQAFDLMIAVDKLDPAAITDIIVRAARTVERKHPMTDEKRAELLTLSFACRVRAIIRQMTANIPGLAVDVSPDYTVALAGNVVQEHEKIRIEERVQAIPGVRSVNNRMTVGAPFGRKNGPTR